MLAIAKFGNQVSPPIMFDTARVFERLDAGGAQSRGERVIVGSVPKVVDRSAGRCGPRKKRYDHGVIGDYLLV